MKGVPKQNAGPPDFPRRPLADKFLYRVLVRVNAYKCAKFQLPSSISNWDIKGSQNKQWELMIFTDPPLADKFYTGR